MRRSQPHPTPPAKLAARALLLAACACFGCQPSRNDIFSWVDEGAGTVVSGGAGSSGSSTAGQAAGSGGQSSAGEPGIGVPADAGSDPSVTFEWTPTLPQRDVCAAGLFLGNFSCSVQGALLSSPLEGTLVLTLTGPTEAGTLEVSRGKLTIITEPLTGQTVTANVLGRVGCPGGFFMAAVEQTMLKPEQLGLLLGWQVAIMSGSNMLTAGGTLAGRLDANSVALTGPITLMIGGATCVGQFSLRAAQQ